MTEDHTPESNVTDTGPGRPTPTHIVEVYLQDAQTLASCARTEKYFYGSERAAEARYVLVQDHLKSGLARDDNGGLLTLEVDDLYGRGTLVVRDLRGVRLIASAEFDDWTIAREGRIARVVAEAKHAASVG